MFVATSDFTSGSISVEAGEVIKVGTFEPQTIKSLVAQRLVTEQKAKKESSKTQAVKAPDQEKEK